MSLCLLAMYLPPRVARAQTNIRVQASPEPVARPAGDYFLRDSIPASSFVADPPDSTDEDFVLPEEKSKKQLAKEIAIWTIAAAFVAFFIIKVFIQEDDEPADDDDGGKDIPPPE